MDHHTTTTPGRSPARGRYDQFYTVLRQTVLSVRVSLWLLGDASVFETCPDTCREELLAIGHAVQRALAAFTEAEVDG